MVVKSQIMAGLRELDKDTLGFSIFNDRGEKWEVAWMTISEMENYIPDVAAVGMIFPKKSAAELKAALQVIINQLEKVSIND